MEHLFRQTIRPTQIIIIDNGSTDGSADGVKSRDGVLIRRLDSNLGFAAANNLALGICETDLVALLNPDAFPEPDWLEKLISAAQEHPDVAAFASRQMIEGASGILDGAGDVYHVSGLVWRDGFGRGVNQSDFIAKEVFSACACAALYRREALLKAGGFDDDYFCYVEDVDLGFRLRLAGHKAVYVPDAVVSHVGSATTGGRNSDFSVYHGHRNLVWTYVKNMPGALLWLFLPVHLLLNIISLIWFACRGQGKVVWRAKVDAVKALPAVWAKRAQIQKSRVATYRDILRVMDKSLFPKFADLFRSLRI